MVEKERLQPGVALRRYGMARVLVGALVFTSFSACSARAQSLSLAVRPDRDRIYLGESFNLHVTVNGADDGVEAPDLSAFAGGAETVFLGSQSNSRRSVSIINGRFSQEAVLARTFVFQVRPRHEGLFATGPVTLRHGGRTLSAAGPPVTVTGITRQSVVAGALAASATAALVDEPFRITLSLVLAPLPPPYHDVEPVHPERPPRLEAAFLDLAEIKGLKQPDLRAILSDRARAAAGRIPAFHINDYTRDGFDMGNLFSFDMGPRPIRFRFEPARENRGGTNVWVYSLGLDYTPQAEGDYTFGPLIFKGPVLTGVDPGGSGRLEEIFAVAPAVTVRVTPPPEEGRPEWFVGAVGRGLAARAALDAAVCKVGDPLTLTLDVTGAISLSNLRPPLLGLQEELVRDFRIYDNSVATAAINGGKRFTWRVRPLRAGTLEFPPVRLAYYDTAARAYVTVATAPIPVQARPTTQVVSDDPETGGSRLALRSDDAPRPAAITLAAEPSPLLPPARLAAAALAGGPAALLAALAGRFVWRRRRALRLAVRRRGAAARARRLLAAAGGPAAVAGTLRGYLAERLDTPGRSLTPPEAARLLAARGLAPEQAAAWQALLERLDEALYRPGAETPAAADAAALLAATETALAGRKSGGKSGNTSIISILSTLSILSTSCLAAANSAAPDASRAFAWERANARLAAARTAADFHEAAQAYNRLVRDGDTRGAVFYNLGTALLLAGDAPNAIAALARAERRLGSTPATRTNLRLAYGLLEAPAADFSPQALPPAAPPLWTHTALFWHYEFPCRHRVAVALAGWGLLFLGLLLRLARPAAARPLLCAGLFLCAVFGASAAVSLLQEFRDAQTWPARVFTAQEQEGTP